MSHLMTKPTKWFLHPAKTQISLGIRPVWSESSLSLATDWVHSEDSDQTGQMPRLTWVFAGRTSHIFGFVTRRLIKYSFFMYSICNPLIFIVRKIFKKYDQFSKQKRRPTYLLILKLTARSIAKTIYLRIASGKTFTGASWVTGHGLALSKAGNPRTFKHHHLEVTLNHKIVFYQNFHRFTINYGSEYRLY